MRSPRKYLEELGHSPYRPDQPNGWPDTKLEWLSPELLIRRLTFARRFSSGIHRPQKLDFEEMVSKNFDDVSEVMAEVEGVSSRVSEDYRMQILFPSARMLLS